MENKSAQTFSSGSSTTLDIFLKTTASDSLFNFSYGLSITGATGGSGVLQFSNPQVLDEHSNTSYVYFPNTPLNPPWSFNQTRTSTTTLTGSDQAGGNGTGAFTFYPLDNSKTYLLARINLEHIGPLTTSPSTFTVSMTSFTGNEDSTGTPIGAVSLSGVSTTLTFQNPVSAVPEPSSLLAVGGILSIAGVVRRRLQKRRSTK